MEITEAIEIEEAIAASGASKKDNFMVGHCIITDAKKIYMLENTVYHKNWENDLALGSKTTTLLELMKILLRKEKRIQHRKIRIEFDNRKAHRQMKAEIRKHSKCAQDTRAEITTIKEIINEK